jgi:hypothetical protein
LLAEAGDGRLQVWASEDPAAPGPIEPDLGAAVDPGAFVAFKIRLNAEAGGYRALDLQGWTGVEVSEDGWEPVSVTLAGVQTEVTAVIEAGSTYVGSGGVFKPATSDVRRVAMPHGSRHELRLDVAEPRLPPGLHMFLLEFPVWVTEDGNPEGDPDGIALLTVIYNVFDEERAVRVRDFCDVAIPLVDGRAPSESGFSRLRELAQSNLEDLTLEPLLAAIGKVQAEIARPITQGGFSTGPLVEAVSDACGRYDLYSVAAAS